MKTIFSLILVLFTGFATLSNANEIVDVKQLKTASEVKAALIARAGDFIGLGDQDLAIQTELMRYVDRLLELAPQKSILDRKNILVGAWQQVWGPYEYRKNDRSVDPTTDPNNIFQVVSPEGYYYNVGNFLDKKTKKVKRITLLRGEYDFLGGDDLRVKFTKLTRIKKVPESLALIDLPMLSEAKQLEGERKSLPNWFVRLTFSGGVLTELYTDKDLRVAKGSSDSERGIEGYLYIMVRADKN